MKTVSFSLNGIVLHWEVSDGETLLTSLRREGYFGVKFGGVRERGMRSVHRFTRW